MRSSPFLLGTVSESCTGPLDYGARDPVPDPEPCLSGMSRETTTDKSSDTGMRVLHVYVVIVILPTKTRVEVSLCFVRHL